MTEPDQNEQQPTDQKTDWQRRHHNVQLIIAIGGMCGIVLLIMQWWQMRAALQTDQRAWLGPVGFAVVLEVGKPIEVTSNFTNTGKTPALNVFVQSVTQLTMKDQGPDFTRLDKEANDNQDASRMTVYPGGGPYAGIGKAKWGPVTEAHIQQLKSGELRIFHFGRIHYDDIFGRSHWSTFCTLYEPVNNQLTYWREGNGAD